MNKVQGFTFFEFLGCMAIMGLLLLMGLPSLKFLVANNQLNVMGNELSMAIKYARNRALLQGRSLALTPRSTNHDWSAGMVLFVDNKKHQFDEKAELIQQWQWHHPGLRVNWLGFQSNAYLLFSPDLKHAATSGHFTIINAESKQLKLVVNRLGRVSQVPT